MLTPAVLTLSLLLGASAPGWAQGAQAAPPATPQPAAPQPGAPAPAPDAVPAPEAYTYEPDGRRDPFVSLLSRGADQATPGRKTAGLSGLATGDVMVRGVLVSRGAFVAMVSGPDGKTYTAHANDRLLDGVIRTVTANGIVIMQEVNDPLSLVKQREVRKGLRTAEDVK
jgi:type IV pilus assembly protein PilP